MREEGVSGAMCTEEDAMSKSLSSILYPVMVGYVPGSQSLFLREFSNVRATLSLTVDLTQ